MRAPLPSDDADRVAALHRLGVLDQPAAPDLDALTRLATRLTGASAAAVNLIDASRQWPAAATGLQRGEVPREQSMCAHVVRARRTVHVADASRDERFADNPFVTGEISRVRLYAGVPVLDHRGHAVGSLCVVDPVPRALDAGQLGDLHDLARQAEALLELRRRQARLQEALAEAEHRASHDAVTGLVTRRVLVDRLTRALDRAQCSGTAPTVFACDVDGFRAVNDAHGHAAGDAVLRAVADRLRAAVRSCDTVARPGGDEFVVLCEDLPADMVFSVAERLRRHGAAELGAPPGCEHLRLSVGTVTAALPSTAEEVLRVAGHLLLADRAARRSPPHRPAGPADGAV